MKITCLGVGSSFPRPDQYQTNFLVEHKEKGQVFEV